MAWTDLLWVVAALFVGLYFYLTATFDSFDQKRVPFRKPYPLLGNMAPVFFKRKSLAQLTQDFYHDFKHYGVGGVFEVRKPVLLVCDPEVIHAVCVKEHECFVDHNLPVGEYVNGLFEKSLIALKGKRWQDVRSTLNPAFSPEKVQKMLPLVSECGQRLLDHLKVSSKQHTAGTPQAVELQEMFSRGVADVINAAAFGTPASHEFFHHGREAVTSSSRKAAVSLGYLLAPGIMEVLGVNVLSSRVQSYFRDLVRDALSHRERPSAPREGPADMLQRMVDARRGLLIDAATTIPDAVKDSEDTTCNGRYPPKVAPLSDDDVTAQLMMFFLAGYDTVCTTLCFLTHLLAVHPRVQEKVSKEIADALTAADNKLTYDLLQKLSYLDMVISETLRMFPPNPVAGRSCTRTAVIRGSSRRSGFVLRPGDAIWIPIYALHNDPDFFPEPEKFDPERFSEENKQNIVPYSYIPFGAGPRSCIGMNFAIMEVKTIMVHLLTAFEIKVVDKTPIPLKLSKESCQMGVDEGFWVGIEPKQNQVQITV